MRSLTGESCELFITQVPDSVEVLRLMLVGLVTKMLKHCLQLELNLVEGLDRLFPALWLIHASSPEDRVHTLVDGKVPFEQFRR
jgi:hypothetical protein